MLISDIGAVDHDVESGWGEIRYWRGKKTLVVMVYRPPMWLIDKFKQLCKQGPQSCVSRDLNMVELFLNLNKVNYNELNEHLTGVLREHRFKVRSVDE